MNHDRAIIVLTSGMHTYGRDKWKADFDARLRLRAGVELYRKYKKKGFSPILIVSGGRTYGENNPDLAKVLGKEAYKKYHIPKEDIEFETKSIDTTENAEFTAKMLRNEGLENRVDIVTNDYHVPRSLECFRIYGIKARGRSAEEVLMLDKDERIKKVVREWEQKPQHILSHIREAIYLGILKTVGPAWFRKTIHKRIEKYGHR